MGWRWLFFLEGMPAIVLGVGAFFYLTVWPGEATWLASERRQWIEQKLQQEKAVGAEATTTILLLAAGTFLNYLAT